MSENQTIKQIEFILNAETPHFPIEKKESEIHGWLSLPENTTHYKLEILSGDYDESILVVLKCSDSYFNGENLNNDDVNQLVKIPETSDMRFELAKLPYTEFKILLNLFYSPIPSQNIL